MKVFVATRATQGLRDDDFCSAVPGELVRCPLVVCSCPSCGCAWSMAGLSSSRATTTFAVNDRSDLDVATYADLVVDALSREGWIGPRGVMGLDDGKAFAAVQIDLAEAFELGVVLEIRKGEISVRSVVSS